MNVDYAVVDEVAEGAGSDKRRASRRQAAPAPSPTLEEKIQADTMRREVRRRSKRGQRWLLQNTGGMNRREARRAVYGDTRREATSHPTRGQLLIQQSLQRRLRLRWKRRQAVASSIAVMEASL